MYIQDGIYFSGERQFLLPSVFRVLSNTAVLLDPLQFVIQTLCLFLTPIT